jgi:hypothetical protein
MLIPDPDFYPSRISDPGSRIQQQKRREKKVFRPPFFVTTNIPKLNYFYFLTGKEKELSQSRKNYSVFYLKIVTRLLKILVWDRDSENFIPEPGS